MKIRLSELRKLIRETISDSLNETRPWGRAIGAEWDEGPEGDRYDRAEYYRKKAKSRIVKKPANATQTHTTPKQDDSSEKKNELDEKDSWLDTMLAKAKKVAMTDIGGPEGFLTPASDAERNSKTKKGGPSSDFLKWQEKQRKKGISETGAYYGKTAPAMGVPLGGNGQKDPNLTSACGDPKCPGCDED